MKHEHSKATQRFAAALIVDAIILVLILMVYVATLIGNIRQGSYADGVAYMKNEEYTLAINKFSEVMPYKDSDVLIQECENALKYRAALKHIECKDYDDALDILCALPSEYEDVVTLTEKTRQNQASLLLDQIEQASTHQQKVELIMQIQDTKGE